MSAYIFIGQSLKISILRKLGMKIIILYEEDCLYDEDFFMKLIDTLFNARSKYVKENTIS